MTVSFLKRKNRVVVWGMDVLQFHIAKDNYDKTPFVRGASMTRCRRLVHCPVVSTREMDELLSGGKQNCPKCFK